MKSLKMQGCFKLLGYGESFFIIRHHVCYFSFENRSVASHLDSQLQYHPYVALSDNCCFSQVNKDIMTGIKRSRYRKLMNHLR